MAQAEVVKIRWLGQACFLVTTPDGIKVLFDPYVTQKKKSMPRVRADVVTLSHGASDNVYGRVSNKNFSALRGVSPDGRDWNHIQFEIADARLSNVASFRDDEQGDREGLNSIFVLELPNCRLVHLGGLAHELDEAQIEPLHAPDILFVSVSGDPQGEEGNRFTDLISQLEPKSVIVPMISPSTDSQEARPKIAPFLEGKNVHVAEKNQYEFDTETLPAEPIYLRMSAR